MVTGVYCVAVVLALILTATGCVLPAILAGTLAVTLAFWAELREAHSRTRRVPRRIPRSQ